MAEPSGFAKFLSATLTSQKGAIETYVKERVTQALDDTAAANAQLQSLTAASAARQSYETAYKEAQVAKQTVGQPSPAPTAAFSDLRGRRLQHPDRDRTEMGLRPSGFSHR